MSSNIIKTKNNKQNVNYNKSYIEYRNILWNIENKGITTMHYWYNYDFNKKTFKKKNFIRWYWHDLSDYKDKNCPYYIINSMKIKINNNEMNINELKNIENELEKRYWKENVSNPSIKWINFYNKYLDRINYTLQKRMFNWICSIKTINGTQIPEDVEKHINSFF